MIEEIKKNAPQGATHYIDDEYGITYMMYDSPIWLTWSNNNGLWMHYIQPDEHEQSFFKPL